MMRVSFEDSSHQSGDDRHVFARFHFNGNGAADKSARDFETGLRQVGETNVCEVWRCDGPSETALENGVSMVSNEQYLLLSAFADDADMRAASQDVYDRILGLVASKGYPNIVRAWNAVPDINTGEGDDEHYKQFCVGRSDAFDAFGHADGPPPAATAVGSVAPGPLRVSLLASHKAPRLLENPRQVSAYQYPRQYGPRSPAFSRAAVLNGDDNLQVFLSGTAAITGHETRHIGDAGMQIAETLENIRHLAVTAGLGTTQAVLRVYIRDPELRAEAVRYVDETFTNPPQMVVLAAELCRRELLVEIDGILRAAD
ncbi:MAG: pteridine-dependent deoxygenase like protein [Pseudomonadota bacterium]